jgi:hypothetical protein
VLCGMITADRLAHKMLQHCHITYTIHDIGRHIGTITMCGCRSGSLLPVPIAAVVWWLGGGPCRGERQNARPPEQQQKRQAQQRRWLQRVRPWHHLQRL